MTKAGGGNIKKAVGAGGIRGEIREWSYASQRRLREYLMTYRPRVQSTELSLTLTIPGPNIGSDEARKLWNHFGVLIRRMGCGAVWRLETQKRGMPHWHLLMVVPWSGETEPDPAAMFYLRMSLCKAWAAALDGLGPVTHENGIRYEQRSKMPGAFTIMMGCKDERAARIDYISNDGAGWSRYLCDHTSKGKQEQIAKGFGRHWGVIGREHFAKAAASESVHLTRAQYFRFLRMLQRWNTPLVRDSRVIPWGRRKGYRIKRGQLGRAVWFGPVALQRRLIKWATEA